MEWVYVNLKNNFITVTAQEAKSKRLWRIPIYRSLRELLVKLNMARNGNRYVFQNPKQGKPYLPMQKRWRRLLARTGIKDMRSHDLRHTFASYFLINGGRPLHF